MLHYIELVVLFAPLSITIIINTNGFLPPPLPPSPSPSLSLTLHVWSTHMYNIAGQNVAVSFEKCHPFTNQLHRRHVVIETGTTVTRGHTIAHVLSESPFILRPVL